MIGHGVGSTLALCAGLALGQAWAFAEPQGPQGPKPAPRIAPQKAAPSAPGCARAIVVPDESFLTLTGGGLRDASVWIDDVNSGLSGRFTPFDVYVVTGRVSAPFTLPDGKLGRDGFRSFTTGNYNTVLHGPLVIDKDARQGQRAFIQDGRTFTLRVLGVQASTFSRDTVTVQLCW